MYERVKALAKSKGLSINALEQELGFARGSLCKLSVHKPSGDKIEAISNYFGVSADFILTGKENTPTPTTADSELWINIRHNAELMDALPKYFKLDKQKQRYVLELIEIFSK